MSSVASDKPAHSDATPARNVSGTEENLPCCHLQTVLLWGKAYKHRKFAW